MDKINVRKITCKCLEGDGFGSFTNLKEADSFMWCNSLSAPELGYQKWQVEIEWEDGKTFSFRHDIAKNKDDNSITGYLRNASKYFLEKEIPDPIKSSDFFKQGQKFHKELKENYAIY